MRPARQKPRKSLPRRILGRLLQLVALVIGLAAAAVAAFAFKAASETYPNDRRVASTVRGLVGGAYHVHSAASHDASGAVEDIASAAHDAGLSFVVLTDHDAAPAPARLVGGVLVITATELSTPAGHLVALGLPRALTEEEREGDAPKAVAQLGGAAILAHPVQEKNPWRAWSPLPQVAGLELYSADTMLRDATRAPFSRLLPAAGAYLTSTTHALYTLVDEQPEATARLLELSAESPKVALCAADAHGTPDYEDLFRAMAMYSPSEGPLPADPERAAAWVISELVAGRALCTFRALGDPAGFRIDGVGPGRKAAVGSKLRVVPPQGTPDAVEIRVTGPAHVERDRWTVALDSPGPVQIELWRRAPGRFLGSEMKPWIVPSPVLAQ